MMNLAVKVQNQSSLYKLRLSKFSGSSSGTYSSNEVFTSIGFKPSIITFFSIGFFTVLRLFPSGKNAILEGPLKGDSLDGETTEESFSLSHFLVFMGELISINFYYEKNIIYWLLRCKKSLSQMKRVKIYQI